MRKVIGIITLILFVIWLATSCIYLGEAFSPDSDYNKLCVLYNKLMIFGGVGMVGAIIMKFSKTK